MNRCSSFWNVVPGTELNVFVIRMLMVSEIFVLFVMYVILLFILKKSIHNLSSEEGSESKLTHFQSYFNVNVHSNLELGKVVPTDVWRSYNCCGFRSVFFSF